MTITQFNTDHDIHKISFLLQSIDAHNTSCLKKNCAKLFFAPCLSNMNRFQ